MHVDTLRLPGGQARLRLDTGRATTTKQHQVPRALVHQPLRGAQAEAAQAARDQVGRLGTELQRLHRLFAGFHQAFDRVAIGHHDLADLPRLLHVAEGLGHVVGVEFAERQRVQDALLEQFHHLPEQTTGQVRTLAHQLVGVDAEVADVVAERTQADAGVLVEVALAQFKEAAERLEHLEVAVDRFASQGVEHHVNATPVGQGQHLIGIGQGTRIKDLVDPQQTQEVALLIAAGGGIDLGTTPLGDLDRGNPDTTGGAVDQHLLAGLQTRQMMQRVIHGEEGTWNGRRRLEGHALGDASHGIGVGHQAVGETARTEAHYAVARGEVAEHRRPFAVHHTGKFKAHGRPGEAIFDGLIGQQAEGKHHVTEVQASGAHFNVQFVRRRRGQLAGFPAQVTQLPRQVEAQADARVAVGTGTVLFVQDTQARHITLAVGADRHFGLGVGVQQGRDQAGDRRSEGQVEQTDPATGRFVRQSPAEAPERRIGNGIDSAALFGSVQVTRRATGQQPALWRDRQRLAGLDQRRSQHAPRALAIEPLAAVKTGQVQHVLWRLIQRRKLLRQGLRITWVQQADLLALLTQGLGQLLGSRLPGFGQQRPALHGDLRQSGRGTRAMTGQQQVTAAGIARQCFQGVADAQAVTLQLMQPELRPLLTRQCLLRAGQPPVGLGTEHEVGPARRVLRQHGQLPVRVEVAGCLAQRFANVVQGRQVGRQQHPVVTCGAAQLFKIDDLQCRAIIAEHLCQLGFCYAVAVVDAIKIDSRVQRFGKG